MSRSRPRSNWPLKNKFTAPIPHADAWSGGSHLPRPPIPKGGHRVSVSTAASRSSVLRGSQNAYRRRTRTSRLPTLHKWGRAATGTGGGHGRSPRLSPTQKGRTPLRRTPHGALGLSRRARASRLFSAAATRPLASALAAVPSCARRGTADHTRARLGASRANHDSRRTAAPARMLRPVRLSPLRGLTRPKRSTRRSTPRNGGAG
jgi:hypothetical protein